MEDCANMLSQFSSICLNHEFQQKLIDRPNTKQCHQIWFFFPLLTAIFYENIENPKSCLETEYASPSTICPSRKLNPQFPFEVFDRVATASRTLRACMKKDEPDGIEGGKFNHKELIKSI